ncbi:DGQHR domain-containing protein [uncultured Maribacter sp.]|uniref:DGQHR domain-containing protein n=1 Tax=uncultured Maribacter sp. TaxID=431308 RepID=UPI0026284DFE|nr:DGQHR domain-containing protein [uncultured Maribacter sp.]
MNDNYKLAVPCLRGIIGDWVYYTSLMSAKQISDTVSTVKEIREAKTLDEVLQRKLKERKADIARYLISKDSRFFNSIILGVFDNVPKWIEFDLTDKFNAVLKGEDIENSESSMGIMIFNGNEKIFAIDGQHRVEGIKIAYQKCLDANVENSVLEDQYPVIFIAHVDDNDGRKRTRRLFSDINTNAKQVSKGDRIIIDEDDIKAIVARKLYQDYANFSKNTKSIISVSEQANLEKDDDKYFTNLITLHTVNIHLKKLYRLPNGTSQNDKENVTAFYKIVTDFYDRIIRDIEDYKKYFLDRTSNLSELRLNNKYLLFRPVGLILITRIYCYYYKKESLDLFSKNINKLCFVFPESPLNGVIWNNGKMEVRAKNQNLSYDLCLYLLNELPENKKPKLLETYREITKNKDASLPEKIVS